MELAESSEVCKRNANCVVNLSSVGAVGAEISSVGYSYTSNSEHLNIVNNLFRALSIYIDKIRTSGS